MTQRKLGKLGKTPARGLMKLRFGDYLDRKALQSEMPKHPSNFGHEGLIAAKDWAMLANDHASCCVFSGAAHETRIWNYASGRATYFSDDAVLSDYSAVTGYRKGEPSTDNGSDMLEAAKYRRDTGIIDGHGKRHKVAAFLSIQPGNLEQHLQAAWLFGAVGIGVMMPSYAQEQFEHGQPWDVQTSETDSIVGGHYICIVANRDGAFKVVTWGALQPMTPRFLSRFNDESVVYLSMDDLNNGKSPEAFDYETLQRDLAGLTA